MKGIRRLATLTTAVSLALLLGGVTVPNVYAEGDHDGNQKEFMNKDQFEHGKHGRHDMHGKHHQWNMFRGLNLNAAQKEQIKGVMKGHHKEFVEGRIATLQARQNLMLATTSTTFDQAAVHKAFGEVSAAQEKMILLRAKVFSEVMPILTPDQQAVVSGRIAKAKLHIQKTISKLESKEQSPNK